MVKNSILELEKYFIELNDIELKDRETKIKREIEKLFLKPIFVSIDDMDRFEKKRNEENKTNKKTWCHRLISYILKPLRKSVGGFKDNIVSLFKTRTPKKTVYIEERY